MVTKRTRWPLHFFSRSELMIESEVRGAESLEARSAESRSDVAPNARRRAQADAIYIGRTYAKKKIKKMRILRRKEFSYVVSDKRVGFEVEIAYALILTEDNKTVIA